MISNLPLRHVLDDVYFDALTRPEAAFMMAQLKDADTALKHARVAARMARNLLLTEKVPGTVRQAIIIGMQALAVAYLEWEKFE